MDDVKRPSGCGWFSWVLLAAIIAFLSIRSEIIRRTSADYVLNSTAQPYIEDAEAFFRTNQILIAQMEPLLSDMSQWEENHFYSFHFSTASEHESTVPAELDEILSKMEVEPGAEYIFVINPDEAEIGFRIEEDARFWVRLLYDAPNQGQESNQDVERWISLDDHWVIHARYWPLLSL